MYKLYKIIIIFILTINFITFSNAKEQSYKILKLVNDKVITNYDLEQRLQLFALLNNQTINKDNAKQYANEMLKLMIDEKLQLEQINKYKIQIQSSEIDEYIFKAFLTSEQNINDFENILISNNIDVHVLRDSLKIQLGWNRLTGQLFYRSAEINNIDLVEATKKNPSLTKDQIENSLIQKQIGLRAEKLLRDLRLEANIENR
ncbi:SurA N-terminal domain-containing protein [Pelagibacteraceae bacterium]|nr:SurA N-terminal domain-containing protein [Pelagibacteraceae bacterium]